jgi:endonuclease/exonuclease/phosphatase family metal-dependent hydrolase
MRGMGWTVYLTAAAFLGIAFFRRADAEVGMNVTLPNNVLRPIWGLVLVMVFFVWPAKTSDFSSSGTLRAATYNIHYGYDDDWHYTLDRMVQTIEENDCDLVMLQEVDTGRMTSYMVDNAYYLARTLKMQVAYLPTVEHLTGISILYRGPKVSEEFQLISSLQEQTGIIGLPVSVTGRSLHAYGIWMGLSKEDTERQIQEALDFIQARSPAMFGGDFNADPESVVAEAIRMQGFEDPFEVLGVDPAPFTSPAIQPRKRIDFVWVRDLTVKDAWVSESLASDHRMVVVEVEFRP